MKIEAMRLGKNKAEKLLKEARAASIYQQHEVSFLEEPGSSPDETKIVIDAGSALLAGLAQAYLISRLNQLDRLN